MTVKIDFGSGFVDVSDLVDYNSYTLNIQGFNNNYKSAQSVCKFSLIYQASVYAMWLASTELYLEVYDPLLVFKGRIDKTRSREYNGKLDNTFISIEANDYLSLLDKPVGDIVFADCVVMNPADTANSIVHKLLALATTEITVASITILTVIERFAPSDETQTIWNILDTLLYEYGYSLHLDKGYILTPIKWAVTGTTPGYTFNDTNCMLSIKTKELLDKYDATKVVYNTLSVAEKVRLYTDDNCGYDSNGLFTGYPILPSYFYPPEANVDDTTTGAKQLVYQTYTEDGIKYRTNEGVAKNLDYNYKNFTSDYTAMVTTEDHFVDRSVDTGVTIVAEEFTPKKCRLLYKNNTGVSKNLYYNNVYGTVWYRSAECSSTVGSADSDKLFTYKSQYIFLKTIADDFVKALFAQFTAGTVTYTITSDDLIPVGTIALINTGDGNYRNTLIMSYTYDEQTEQYNYVCISCSHQRPALSGQTYNYKSTANSAPPFRLSATNETISVPYVDGSPVYANAFTTVTILQEGLNVTSGWTLSATTTGVTGHFVGNSYYIDSAPAIGGSVVITASKTGFSNIATVIQVQGTDGGSTWQPLAPLVDVVAEKDGLRVYLTDKYLSGIQGVNTYTATWYLNDVEQATMAFGDLDTILLPFGSNYYEVADIDTMSVKVYVVNTSGYNATTWVNEGFIETSSYGTWLGYEPEVVPRINGRQITLTIYAPPQAQNRERYGTIRYQIFIQKPVSGYDDTIWFKPAVNENPYTSEDNWKAVDQGLGYQSVRDTFQQVVPLDGQSTDSPQDTTYKYKVVMFNEAGEGTAVLQTVIALGTSIKDIVNAAITTNKLAPGAVVNDKIAANTITAEKMFVAMLSAISANIGTITGGMLKSATNDNNLWAMSTMEVDGVTYYEGTMKVGGDNQYLRVTPVIDSITGLIVDYDISFKVGTFTAEADLTSFDGAFFVTDNNNPTFRARIEEYGFFMQKKTGSVWADVGVFKIDRFSNTIITNDTENIPDMGLIDSTAIIYHFNSGVLDTAGTNLGNITTSGTIKNLPSIVENTNYFEGTVARTMTVTKQLVWNKSNLFTIAGLWYQMSNGEPEPITADYNTKASTAWGLTAGQVSAKLFKVRV